MTSLSIILGAGADGGGAVLDPLPTFGIWSNYANNQYTYSVYDSYVNPIGGGYYSTDTEQWSNYSGQTRADSSVGSNSRTTFWSGATPTCQSEGHSMLNFPAKAGTYAAVVRPNWLVNNYWPFYGTVIGEEGIRQRISLYANGNTMAIHSRGGGTFITTINIVTQSLLNVTGEPANTTYGMVSYNSRIGRLVLLRGDGSNNYRLHVWDNPNINLNTTDLSDSDLYTFMLQARNGVNGALYFYNDFQWQTSGSTSYAESQYHLRLIAGDNGYVGLVRMTPNNETRHAYVIPNKLGTSLTQAPTAVSSIGLTTTYGIEQGNDYGMRSTMTWDNRTVACYSPYYYYGSGINMHYVDTTNPSVGVIYQDADTGWGRNVFPIGRSDIAIRPTNFNSDGAGGFYVVIHNPKGAFVNLKNAANTDSAIASGSTIGSMGTYLGADTSYTSTMYPHAIPMTDWTRTG